MDKRRNYMGEMILVLQNVRWRDWRGEKFTDAAGMATAAQRPKRGLALLRLCLTKERERREMAGREGAMVL